ncbi:MAG: hypothetical protein IKN60_01435 [Bacteroidales bacterium]|nr:hypothetical protein [Bacteroidales bacterium]
MRLLLAAVIVFAPLSCSVKEDRTECPVYVTVLTDRFVQQGISDGIISFGAAQPIRRETVSFLSYVREGFEQACPRDFARVSVLAGVDHALLREGTLETPYGSQADLVWAYGETFSAYADEYVVDAVPHKQFCLVRFLFDGSRFAPEDYPWRFRLKAECSGMDIYTLAPLPGPYSALVGPNALGEWYGVLPRQLSNNMLLEVFVPEAEGSAEGRTEYVIDLGKAFEAQGYDWTLEDLKDIEVQVGFIEADLTVTVHEWERSDSYGVIEI